jgi:hypothetical protein
VSAAQVPVQAPSQPSAKPAAAAPPAAVLPLADQGGAVCSTYKAQPAKLQQCYVAAASQMQARLLGKLVSQTATCLSRGTLALQQTCVNAWVVARQQQQAEASGRAVLICTAVATAQRQVRGLVGSSPAPG